MVLRDPQITECCRRNACRPCIEKAINRANGSCPIPGCKTAKVKGFSDRTLKYEILEQNVYCTSKKDASCGCQWVGKLANLDKHLEECPFHEIKCHYRCGVTTQHHNIQDHEVTCERAPLQCHQCGNEHERFKVAVMTRVMDWLESTGGLDRVGFASLWRIRLVL